MNKTASSAGYQVMLASLLSINFGIVFFDRNASSFLTPLIQPDLGLSDTQVGLLASALSLTWAVAAFGIGRVSDQTGSRKGLLVLATVAFSLCSFLTGVAGSFVMLLGARMLMGFAEGGIMPMSQALVVAEVAPRHRGLAMGVTQNFGSNFFGSFVAPVLLPVLAPLSWKHPDDQVRLGHATEWQDVGEGKVVPVGQKMFAVDEDEIPVLDIRNLEFAAAQAAP